MTISGIQDSGAIGGVYANPKSNGAARTDGLLNALRSIDPKLADQLSAQVDGLRSSGATPQQIAQALRQTIGQLAPSDQASVEKALQSIRGRHHGHHHRSDAGGTEAATSSAATPPAATPPAVAASATAIAGVDHDGDADGSGAAPFAQTLDVQA